MRWVWGAMLVGLPTRGHVGEGFLALILTAGCGADSGDSGTNGANASGGGGAVFAPPQGGAANGSAGAAVSGGGADGIEPAGLISDACGGDIEGVWRFNGLSPSPRPIPDNVDSCWNLMLGYSMEDDHLIARSWLQGELAPLYRGMWRFDPVYANQTDLGYVIQEEFKGPVVQTYAPECLVTDRGPVTCEALGPALVSPAEPDYTNVTCTAASEGGCDCTFETLHVTGWADDVVVTDGTVTFQRYVNSQTPVETLTTTYCVEQGDLRFGEAINTWWPDMHYRPFMRQECDNGLQDPGEEGVDCGGWCDLDCP